MIPRLVAVLLRIVLVLLFGILLVFQVLSMPGHFRYLAGQSPDLAGYRWPLTGLAVFWILCVQVVLVCTWHLLTMVQQESIFTEASLRWVDTIVGAVAAVWLSLLGVGIWVAIVADDPGPPMLVLLVGTAVTAFGLLMWVLRSLLRTATELRTDLDGVI